MNIVDSYIAYGEQKLGTRFPEAAVLPAQIDNMDPVFEAPMTHEQRLFLIQTGIEMGKSVLRNVVHPVLTTKVALGKIAGSQTPELNAIGLELERQNIGWWEHEQVAHEQLAEARRTWRSDLIHMNGLRQALQQRRQTR